MVLNSLPDEIKIQVFHHIQTDKWGRRECTDLANVVLCCRHFYELAIPILYSSFHGPGQGKLHSLALLRTLLMRPDLAKYCRNLTGLCAEQDIFIADEINRLRPSRWSSFQHKIIGLKAALDRVCDDKVLRHRWRQSFSIGRRHEDRELYVPGNWDSITALLILLLPNLSTLELPLNTPIRDDDQVAFLPYVFCRAVRMQNIGQHTPYSLSNLRSFKVSLRGPPAEYFFPSLESIIPFLRLKSLRGVSCTATTDEGSDTIQSEHDITNPISHITHLSFDADEESDVDSRSLGNFLQTVRLLTSFSYVHWTEFAEPYPFIPSEVGRGLSHSKDSLQALTLVNEIEDYQQADEYDDDGKSTHKPENKPVAPLGSLNDFRQLRRLEVSAVALTGRDDAPEGMKRVDFEPLTHSQCLRVADGLPNSLEELVLRACFPPIYQVIEALFERKRHGQLKRLKKIDLAFQKDLSDEEVFKSKEGNKSEAIGEQLGIRVTRNLWTLETPAPRD